MGWGWAASPAHQQTGFPSHNSSSNSRHTLRRQVRPAVLPHLRTVVWVDSVQSVQQGQDSVLPEALVSECSPDRPCSGSLRRHNSSKRQALALHRVLAASAKVEAAEGPSVRAWGPRLSEVPLVKAWARPRASGSEANSNRSSNSNRNNSTLLEVLHGHKGEI